LRSARRCRFWEGAKRFFVMAGWINTKFVARMKRSAIRGLSLRRGFPDFASLHLDHDSNIF
jgi:hypothetical protein